MLHQKLKKVNKDDCKIPAEKFLESVPKPALIPPQTPPAGGKTVEAGRIHSPRQIVSPCRVRFNHLDFARNSFELCPTNTAKNRNRIFGGGGGIRTHGELPHSSFQDYLIRPL